MKPDTQTRNLIAYSNHRRDAAKWLQLHRHEFTLPHGVARRWVAARFLRSYQFTKETAVTILRIYKRAEISRRLHLVTPKSSPRLKRNLERSHELIHSLAAA